jgi:2-polyprenyl-3-methyl-5-hydroxy-6-metoxy-1,4-benzoquinol methylase
MENRSKHISCIENQVEEYRTRKIDAVTRIFWDLNYSAILEKALRVSMKGQRILEVGCGTGAFITALAKEGRECHGIDPVIGLSLAEAKKRAREEETETFLCKAVGEHLPYKNKTFDLILCLSTLQHVFNQENTLREIRRTIKSDGKVLISVPTTKNIRTLFREIVPKHFTAGFDLTTIRKLLAYEGFQILEMQASGFFPPFLIKGLQVYHALFGEAITRNAIEVLDKIANKWLSSAGNLIFLCSK